MKRLRERLAGTVVAAITAGACFTNAAAQTVIDEWESAKLPPPPALKPATINPVETALLVMDFTIQTCSMRIILLTVEERRPLR